MIAVVTKPHGDQMVWDGRSVAGSLASPGIYFWRLEAGAYRREGKVVMVR